MNQDQSVQEATRLLPPREGQASAGRYGWTGSPAEPGLQRPQGAGISTVTPVGEARFPAVTSGFLGGHRGGYSEDFTQIPTKKLLFQNYRYN